MGFDGFLVPDWAKPYVGYAVGMDWPEGDEDGCFRLADACANCAQTVAYDQGLHYVGGPGEDWDGDALKEFLEHIRDVSEPGLVKLVEQLVQAALQFNDLGVQVEYTKRMIEVSVWMLIFQLGWLLAAALGPWGGVSLALVGARVQLTRLAIAQLGKRLLINVGLFGGLMAGMDLGVQLSQSRRDHLDWEQIMTSGGTGALMGAFLTLATGVVPTRSIWGLMGRSGLASGATDLSVQLFDDKPMNWDRLVKSVTSGVLGGADAHWASWSPGAHHAPGLGDGHKTTGSDTQIASHRTDSDPQAASQRADSEPQADSHRTGSEPVAPHRAASDPYLPLKKFNSTDVEALGSAAVSPHTVGEIPKPWRPADPPSGVPEAAAKAGTAVDSATTLVGTGTKHDVTPAAVNSSVDSLINGHRTAEAPPAPKADNPGLPYQGSVQPHQSPVPHAPKTGGPVPHQVPGPEGGPHGGGKKPDVESLLNPSAAKPEPATGPSHTTTGPTHAADASASAAVHADHGTGPAHAAHPDSPFKILKNPGESGDGYAAPGLWGKYGAAGVMVRGVDAQGEPRYLLVQRGSGVTSNVGKWQLPGGALESRETPAQGAARELSEELGVGQAYLDTLKLTGEHAVEGANGWTYTNMAAEGQIFNPKVDGSETGAAKWVTLVELHAMADQGALHPALAKALPDLLALFDQGTVPVVRADHGPHVMDGYRKIGGQEGSNLGGRYVDRTGDQVYVKAPRSDLHARNEVLANRLYQEAGTRVPRVDLIDLNGNFGDRGLGVRSVIVDGVGNLTARMSDPVYRKDLFSDFAVDAWLANWDTVGLLLDNVVTTPDGRPLRIDGGGSLLFRAQGDPKGHLFGDTVGEIHSLRDPAVNPQSAKVFQQITEADIRAGVEKIKQISEHRIDELVDQVGFRPHEAEQLKSTLKARREDLIARYLPEETRTSAADPSKPFVYDGPLNTSKPRHPDVLVPHDPYKSFMHGGDWKRSNITPPLSGLSTFQPGQLLPGHTPVLHEKGPPTDVPIDAPFGSRLVDTSYGSEVWSSLLDGLSPEAATAVEYYAASGYITINGVLRRGDVFMDAIAATTGIESAEARRHVERLNEVMRQQPLPHTIDVYRAVTPNEGLFTVPIEELPGTIQSDPGFLSTNIGAEPIWGARKIILHLRVPEGTPAIYVEPVSKLGERELLLASGRSFYVEEVTRKDGTWNVYGWVLPDEAGR